MNSPNPLEQLKDIHLPEQISAWPPAYGWWILLTLTLIVIALSMWGLRRYLQHNKARKDAIKLLKQLNENSTLWDNEINAVLKRVCVSYFPAENAAGLYGEEWITFLSSKLPEKSKDQFVQTMLPWQNQLYRSPQPEKTQSDSESQESQPIGFEQVQTEALVWLQRFRSKAKPEAQHV